MSDAPQPEILDHAAIFRAMAEKIDTNRDNGFGGAFVIVAPNGATHDTLILDSAANGAAFWSLLSTRCQIELAEIDKNERGAQGFPMQRR